MWQFFLEFTWVNKNWIVFLCWGGPGMVRQSPAPARVKGDGPQQTLGGSGAFRGAGGGFSMNSAFLVVLGDLGMARTLFWSCWEFGSLVMASSVGMPQISILCRNLSGHVGPYGPMAWPNSILTYLSNLNFKQTLILRVQDVGPYLE